MNELIGNLFHSLTGGKIGWRRVKTLKFGGIISHLFIAHLLTQVFNQIHVTWSWMDGKKVSQADRLIGN